MYGYKSSFNCFIEFVLSDGRVIRKIEQPGGGANNAVIETVTNIDDYMNEADDRGGNVDWIEMSDEELKYVVAQIEHGAGQAKNLFRADAFISVTEAAERARCDISYIKAEIKRYQDSNGQKGLYAQKIGKGRTSGYAIHPDDFRKWMMNPRRGSRGK